MYIYFIMKKGVRIKNKSRVFILFNKSLGNIIFYKFNTVLLPIHAVIRQKEKSPLSTHGIMD